MNTIKLSNQNRHVRVFISSTFRDMVEDRNELMTHCWSELRKFCSERYVELTEVDLRWGVSEEQSTRKETLKFCLDEIRACWPYFIGLLGERYGWVPGDDAFTPDLKEEQPWLENLHGTSVTELEILHGVINDPEMAARAFFFFRDPLYSKGKGSDFFSENEESRNKQEALKAMIQKTCKTNNIYLFENYVNPQALAPLVLEQLKSAIDSQFPIENIPESLDREAIEHEAYADIRRRTYIGRDDYFQTLDQYCEGRGKPIMLLGNSGSGKSALLANWVMLWRKKHPNDFIFQHYIGGTPGSSNHWNLMLRLIKEIKRWTDANEELPKTNEDMLRDFMVWLSKARIKAEKTGVRFIVILDALNQLDDTDHGRILGWLPKDSFSGALHLITSTLPEDTLETIEKLNWQAISIQPLSKDERRRMIVLYLERFSKKLDDPRLDRLSAAAPAANPLFLKILLDELCVTGTHEKLDERLADYLTASDIPSLLRKVLKRYQKDYERDRPGLVGDALSMIWSARNGLTEIELLQLLKTNNLTQLPLAIWAPLSAAMEEGLVDRGGILNFAHDFLRVAVESVFLPDIDKKDDYRIALADFFEAQPPTKRSSDELPWLLYQTEMFDRLRACLLNINYFLEILKRSEDELRRYWVNLGEEKSMGTSYRNSFDVWFDNNKENFSKTSDAAYFLGSFLNNAELFIDAEPLFRISLKIDEETLGAKHPNVSVVLNDLSILLSKTERYDEAIKLMQRALKIDLDNFGHNSPEVSMRMNNLAQLFQATNHLEDAIPLMQKALEINETYYGEHSLIVAMDLINQSQMYKICNNLEKAGLLLQRALEIMERQLGQNDPKVALCLNHIVQIFFITKPLHEIEPLINRGLKIDEENFGSNHPIVARDLNNLAILYSKTNRLKEAESLFARVIKINQEYYGENHSKVATSLNNYAQLLQAFGKMNEAEKLMKNALKIHEINYGGNHPDIAIDYHNLASLYYITGRLDEAVPLIKKAAEIMNNFTRSTGLPHLHLQHIVESYGNLLAETGWNQEKVFAHLRNILPDVFK